MNRLFLMASATALPLVVDASLKSAALLVLAAVAGLLMRRSSAAARHMVWLAAVLALLLVPVLSVVLPGWRILPAWAVVQTGKTTSDASGTEMSYGTYAAYESSLPAVASPVPVLENPAPATESPLPSTTAPVPAPVAAATPLPVPSSSTSGGWLLPAAWAAGCMLLLLRLSAAHWLLHRAARHSCGADESLAETFAAALKESGVRQPVRLLIDSRRTIPVAWGIFRPWLLLPAEALSWDESQLRSVFMHELAHLRRRDPLVQFLTQAACALHWFNPLVWLAAWRLHVERERACDDLVLASGVRPSEYAGHLLHVATQLSPARWTAGCGLAMARKSSLEGRLLAVLSNNLNRRGVTRILATAALSLGAAIAIPVAMLRAAEKKPEKPALSDAHPDASKKPEPVKARPREYFVKYFSGTEDDPTKPLDPEELAREAKIPQETLSHLNLLIYQAAATKNARFRYLLEDAALKKDYALPLAAYDYSVNGNQEALKYILERLSKVTPGSDADEIVTLGYLDEWDLTIAAYEKHFANGKDGAAGEGDEFWGMREFLFPEHFERYFNDKNVIATDGAPAFTPTPAKPAATTLEPDVEKKLKWGETVNGLRAALVIRDTPGESGTPDLYLAVQNVSAAPIRLNDTTAASDLRFVSVHRDELLQSRTKIDTPTQTDVTLQSRESTFLLMIPQGDKPSKGQLLAAGMLKEPHMILSGEMNIGKAPAGAWTGKLVTGATGGATAQIDPAAASKAPSDSTAAGGEKITPKPEENLKWGTPVNGLRAAVVVRHTTDEPAAGEPPELYLALQNVSKAPILLSDAGLGPKDPSRHLYLKEKGEIMFGLGSNKPSLSDLTLQPGDVKTILMFSPETMKNGGHSIGRLMTEGAIKDTHQTFMLELKIEKAPAGAWTGDLRTGDASAYEAQSRPQPKDKKAQELFAVWQHHTRQNGNFPGGLIARLGEKVEEFIRNNTGDASGDPYAKKMAPIVPRLDASRDWTPAEVVALMDDIAAVTSIPMEVTLWKTTENSYTRGEPLPEELAAAPWGAPQPNGLRMAFLLEPRAAEHRLGTPLKARLLFHNSGKDTVVFRTASFHQPGHQAKDAKGAEIKVDSTFWTTLGRTVTFRLAPDEFVEVNTPGIGVGPVGKHDDWQNTRIRVGSWVEAKAGDEVTVTTLPLTLGSTHNEPGEIRSNDPSVWWNAFIKYHLTQDLPFPADPEERRLLVYRAGMELFGTPLSTKEIDSFVNDHTPSALDSLTKLLMQRTDTRPSAGELTFGSTKFRVLPADPDAAKKPRTASSAGQFPIGGGTTFGVITRPDGERIVYDAQLSHSAPEETKPPQPYKIQLPDGYNSWAAAWVRDTTVLWISQKDLLRKYDFTDFSKVQETRFEGDKIATAPVPEAIREALKAELEVTVTPKKRPRAGGPPAATPQ